MRANNVEYFAPARFDDELEIHVRVARFGRTSMTFEFAAFKVAEETLLVTAHQTLVFIDLADRRPIPIPDDYRAPFGALTPTISSARRSPALAARDDCSWAGVFFVEGDELVLGPQAGTPEPERRTAVPVLWRDTRVAELAADGAVGGATSNGRGRDRRPLPRRLGHERRGVAKSLRSRSSFE